MIPLQKRENQSRFRGTEMRQSANGKLSAHLRYLRL